MSCTREDLFAWTFSLEQFQIADHECFCVQGVVPMQGAAPISVTCGQHNILIEMNSASLVFNHSWQTFLEQWHGAGQSVNRKFVLLLAETNLN